jgi:hypothetical protein
MVVMAVIRTSGGELQADQPYPTDDGPCRNMKRTVRRHIALKVVHKHLDVLVLHLHRMDVRSMPTGFVVTQLTGARR